MDLASQAAGIGALAEATRRRLYDYVVAQAGPVGREQAARECGLPRHTVTFHLDRLVEEGLLDVGYRRLTERSGPGSGRPSKLYRRSSREFSVSLPPRRYDLVGEVLASAVTVALDGRDLAGSLAAAAHDAGVSVGEHAVPAGGDDQRGPTSGRALREVAAALEPLGYEPSPGDGCMLLTNCPYHALAQQHTRLICGINQHFVQGVVDGLGRQEVRACLEPAQDRCCVVARVSSGAADHGGGDND